MKTLMKCGPVVNATYNGRTYCIRCNCYEVEDMTSRVAFCRFCGKAVKSNVDLPFFTAGKGFDSFCCEKCF